MEEKERDVSEVKLRRAWEEIEKWETPWGATKEIIKTVLPFADTMPLPWLLFCYFAGAVSIVIMICGG